MPDPRHTLNAIDFAAPKAAGSISGAPQCCAADIEILERLRSYALWTLKIWSTSSEASKDSGLNDLVVIACGLPGEAGEMLEQNALVGTCRENRHELVLEFGDVLYYWARIVRHFGIDMALVLGVSESDSFIPAGAARLPISVGLVCEAIKKYVRNDHQRLTPLRHDKLVEGLGLIWQDMRFLFDLHALHLDDVIEANKAKLNRRLSKQTKKNKKAIEAVPGSGLSALHGSKG